MNYTELARQWLKQAQPSAGTGKGQGFHKWITSKQRSFFMSLVEKADPSNPLHGSNLCIDTVDNFHIKLSKTTRQGACQIQFIKYEEEEY